jgi:uncharacterized protein DUF4129
VRPEAGLAASFVASFVAIVGALAAPPACAQSLPPGSADCVARIEQARTAGTTVGAEPNAAPPAAPVLGDVCPDVAAALAQSAWGGALVGVSADELRTSAFVQLAKLAESYERAAANERGPRAAPLDDVLAELKLDEPAVAPTLWERIRMWIDEHFGGRDAVTPEWLAKWLQALSPSERFVRYLVIALGILLAAATTVVVLNELRVAGLLAGGVLRKYSPLTSSGAEPSNVATREWDDIARAPLARRPALLLAIVLDRLRERGRAPRDSLTHRELLRAATGFDAEQSAAFAAIVAAAERATFGDWRPADRELDGVVARGRALLASFAADAPRKP